MTKWWLSCRVFTIQAVVDNDGYITHTAPIASRFIGQPFTNLTKWMKSLGGFRFERMSRRPEDIEPQCRT